MIPSSPVLLNNKYSTEVIYAENQPQYLPLPAVKDLDGKVITRWKLTWIERLRILFYGNLWLQILTFNRPLQPVKLTVSEPRYSENFTKEN